MKKSTNYLILAGLSLVLYLVIEFTDIYGNPGWFKFFLVLLGVTFLISGIALRRKK
ncbi:hypothetical protein [Winogradskyella pulchriflava]|uniref:Uncharacterized protein n=1 Tax=Winogradskyella pulchriflava TaxID=1110688 RepID=A0ABV6QAU6_9FLAO